MLELPEEFELISFFECEPTLGAPGVPWVYNSVTFQTERGKNRIRFHIEPDFGELEFSWSQAGTQRVNLKINNLSSIQIHIAKDNEYLVASSGAVNPHQLLKIRLKPDVAVEWSLILPPKNALHS